MILIYLSFAILVVSYSAMIFSRQREIIRLREGLAVKRQELADIEEELTGARDCWEKSRNHNASLTGQLEGSVKEAKRLHQRLEESRCESGQRTREASKLRTAVSGYRSTLLSLCDNIEAEVKEARGSAEAIRCDDLDGENEEEQEPFDHFDIRKLLGALMLVDMSDGFIWTKNRGNVPVQRLTRPAEEIVAYVAGKMLNPLVRRSILKARVFTEEGQDATA